MTKEVKIILSNNNRKVELSEIVSENEEYDLWQWKLNLIEPALKALTYCTKDELKDVMENHFKG